MPGDRRAEVHAGNDSRTRTLPWPPRGPSAATGFGRQWREEETEMYFALYSFKVNFAWLCAAAKFVPGSAFQCFSTVRGIRASLPLQLGKISALPYAEEGLWLVPLKTSSSSHKLVLCRKASANQNTGLWLPRDSEAALNGCSLLTSLNTGCNREHATQNGLRRISEKYIPLF